ncbi:hypothetical protein JCM21900_000045 [Sporobolomyces salmonicolor]
MSLKEEDAPLPSRILKDGVGDEPPKQPPPREVSLFSGELKGERRGFLKSFLQGLALTNLFMWCALPIYWGAYFRQEENLYRLTVGVIDMDSPAATAAGRTPVLGPALLAGPSQLKDHHIEFVVLDNVPYDISSAIGGQPRGLDVHQYAMSAVQNEDYFGVIVANANATITAVSAYESLANGTQSVMYDGSGALTMYYSEGRNFETVDQWVAPGMTSFLSQHVCSAAASTLSAQLLPRLGALSAEQYSAIDKVALGSVLAMPFSYTEYNLRPVDEFAAIPATSVGMIYLLIFTYFISIFWSRARAAIENKLRLGELVILRIAVPVAFYLLISLWISLVTLAFHVDFTRFWGKGGFPIFWASNFVCQIAVGMPMEIALAFLGPRYTAFFLIIWVILNVSVAFIDVADQDHFYSYGFIAPIFQAVQVGKAVIFGVKQRFGQYFGINIAWAVIGCGALALTTAFKRKSAIKQKMLRKGGEKQA